MSGMPTILGIPVAGTKHDAGKVRLDLLPPDALLEIGRVLSFGAVKYAPRNWEEGIDHGRLYAAALRHLLAWQQREDRDVETGLPHLAHAACCVMMLLSSSLRGIGTDDRPDGLKTGQGEPLAAVSQAPPARHPPNQECQPAGLCGRLSASGPIQQATEAA